MPITVASKCLFGNRLNDYYTSVRMPIGDWRGSPRRLVAPGPVRSRRRAARRCGRCAAPLLGLRAQQLERARRRQRHHRLEVAEEVKRAQHADQVGELARLPALGPDQRALGDAGLMRERRLREVLAEPTPREPVPELLEDCRIAGATSPKSPPQIRDRHREHAVAEARRHLAVVEHDAAHEPRAAGLAQPPQPPEVRRVHCR